VPLLEDGGMDEVVAHVDGEGYIQRRLLGVGSLELRHASWCWVSIDHRLDKESDLVSCRFVGDDLEFLGDWRGRC
jgi:hypothetical protein